MAPPPSRISKDVIRAARRQRAARLYTARKARWAHRWRRLRRAIVAAIVLFIGTFTAALLLGGLPFSAIVLMTLLGFVTFLGLATFPRSPRPWPGVPDEAGLTELAAATEDWLESRRRVLPSPAVDVIDMIAVRLEQITPQLVSLDETGPAAREVRKLLSEHLPTLVDSYTRIAPSLRHRPGPGGTTPSQQLVEGLSVISDEIETMSIDLSRHDLDRLATRGRYLETRYLDVRDSN